MNNLASSYADAGQIDEALQAPRRDVGYAEGEARPRPPRHAQVHAATCASSYAAAGQIERALKLCEETLALQKAKLGPDHPDTLTSMNNLANSYAAAGQNERALKLREETLALQKAKLGLDHPDTLKSMYNLAISYADRRTERATPQAPRGDAGIAKGEARP